jgi:hypothetical protein
MHNAQDMTKEKWLADCAARFKQRVSDMTDEEAKWQADLALESVDGDLTEHPSDCADEELSCWTDDGE